jgi:hypothetical protein
MNIYVPLFQYLARFSFRMRNVSDKILEKIRRHILCLIHFSPHSRRDNVEKYFTAGQAPVDRMAHAHCTLHTEGYKNTFRICITYCFSTATIVVRTGLTVTSHADCLSFFYILGAEDSDIGGKVTNMHTI